MTDIIACYSGSMSEILEKPIQIKRPFIGIVAHQGDVAHYPGNSLAGYKAVLNMAMLHPHVHIFMETDIRVSGDKQCVAVHDATIDRTHRKKFSTKGSVNRMHFDTMCGIAFKNDMISKALDFEKLRHGTHAPLYPISPPHEKGCGDYRTPNLDELLQLTYETNKYRTQGGGLPVGLCLDIKSKDALPVLAETLNRFIEQHPDARVPLMLLAIPLFIQPEEVDALRDKLSSEAQRMIYDKEVETWERKVHLKRKPCENIFHSVRSAAFTHATNLTSKWSYWGDPDTSLKMADCADINGNITPINTMPDTLIAMGRGQQVVWTDNPLDLMQGISRIDHFPHMIEKVVNHLREETLSWQYRAATRLPQDHDIVRWGYR